MNRIIYTSVILLLLVSTKAFSQNLNEEKDFYKATSYLLITVNSFERINNGTSTAKELLPTIENNVNTITIAFDGLKVKHKQDPNFKEFKTWVEGIRKSYELLKENDPVYYFGASLIKMNIIDFLQAEK
ncbi:hypothetical protein NBRC110019_18120 [Neptunitalea chrysea]|uniref:Uncharacterized protein n=1 Tax=Neptunitalea chrysea TaxID=1647581 RepID=A0A9W6B6L4_9FLAO|nr:hypothetical protein [Neptunitalea chrysea]GLB52772.1 hypothetical protein NBRC110019_18120 [Neptunitalea chrysea]